jgi:putative membrane protein
MLHLISALLLGILTGTQTGLTPGIHINLIAASVLILPITSSLPSIILIIFITSMAITHTFVDFIPAIFLGAPDSDTGLGILPGHELLLTGRGHHALKLTLVGSTIAITTLIIIIPFFIILMPKAYPFIQRMMAFFLIWTSIFLIYNEKSSKINAILIFTLAGFLGIASLNLKNSTPLLPLLTGLFGTSTIIHSIKSKTKIPKQETKKTKISKKELIKPTIATILVSPICSFFPGLGSSQAAIIGSEITGKQTREQFLVLVGSINTLVMSISFLTLYLFQKSRSGTAFAISQITQISKTDLTIIIITIIISAIIAIPITLAISKSISKHIHKIPYIKISTPILILLIIITLSLSGLTGLIILMTSTALGLTCIEISCRRNFLMGAILIPTIIFYSPF